MASPDGVSRPLPPAVTSPDVTTLPPSRDFSVPLSIECTPSPSTTGAAASHRAPSPAAETHQSTPWHLWRDPSYNQAQYAPFVRSSLPATHAPPSTTPSSTPSPDADARRHHLALTPPPPASGTAPGTAHLIFSPVVPSLPRRSSPTPANGRSPSRRSLPSPFVVTTPVPLAVVLTPSNSPHNTGPSNSPRTHSPLVTSPATQSVPLAFGGPAVQGTAASPSSAPVAGDTALPRTDDPWDDLYVPKPRLQGDAPASAYDKSYFFLMKSNFSIIRDAIRSLSVQEKKDCGNLVVNERKRYKVNKLLIHAARKFGETGNVQQMFAPDIDTWYADPVRISIVVPHAPSLATLLGTMPGATGSTGHPAQPPAPDFCTNEFARLVGVLVDSGPYIRGKLLETALSLDRYELDRGVDRDAIWEAAIAPRFNDHSFQVRLPLAGKVTGVDASALPLAPRSAEKLLAAFNKNKSVFTKAYSNWTVSGANDTVRIGDFVATTRGTGAITEDGKRALITFHALRCGTPEADTDLLDFTIKTMAAGVGYDDDDVEENAGAVPRGGSSRKRKRQEAAELRALEQGNDILKDGVSAIMQSLAPRGAEYNDSTARQAKDIAGLTKELTELYSLLTRVRTENQPQALIDRIERSIEMTTRSLDKIDFREDE